MTGLKTAGDGGANWFFWIAALSLVNTIITHSGGGRVAIRAVVQNDSASPAFSVAATSVDTTAMNIEGPSSTINVNTGEQRRVMRLLPGTDTVFHFYVVDTLVDANGPGTRGLAIMPLVQFPAANIPPAPFRNKAFIASESIDASDKNPVSFPHEAGHVLGDTFHASTTDANGKFEMMTGGGTDVNNAENSSKRISDTPVLVKYNVPAANAIGATVLAVADAPRIRTNGAGMLQNW